ncbi:MAG: hypothetical protein ABGX05_08150 [Pirellulaceae bacterium]
MAFRTLSVPGMRKPVRCLLPWLVWGILPLACQAAPAWVSDVVVNPVGATYDSHAAVVVQADGTSWIAWHAYRESRDQVLLRRVAADGTRGPVQIVSQLITSSLFVTIPKGSMASNVRDWSRRSMPRCPLG